MQQNGSCVHLHILKLFFNGILYIQSTQLFQGITDLCGSFLVLLVYMNYGVRGQLSLRYFCSVLLVYNLICWFPNTECSQSRASQSLGDSQGRRARKDTHYFRHLTQPLLIITHLMRVPQGLVKANQAENVVFTVRGPITNFVIMGQTPEVCFVCVSFILYIIIRRFSSSKNENSVLI